jgi:hypothetical protein
LIITPSLAAKFARRGSKIVAQKGQPGRILSTEDIDHYHRIVVALSETIRIMKEIDIAIDAYGGWPGAFAPMENPK